MSINKTLCSRRATPAILILATLVVAVFGVAGNPSTARAQTNESTGKGPTTGMTFAHEIPMTTGEYAQMSQRIVWARCLSVDVHKRSSAVVETYFEFEILETVKGNFADGSRPGARFILMIPEGQVGESKSVSIPPFPKFAPGDEVILLLGRDNDRGAVMSPTQSTYRVRTDAQGRKTVTPRPTGMTLYRADNGGAYGRMPGRPPLEDFIASLRKHVSGQ